MAKRSIRYFYLYSERKLKVLAVVLCLTFILAWQTVRKNLSRYVISLFGTSKIFAYFCSSWIIYLAVPKLLTAYLLLFSSSSFTRESVSVSLSPSFYFSSSSFPSLSRFMIPSSTSISIIFLSSSTSIQLYQPLFSSEKN